MVEFLTAEKLGIQKEEREALIWVLGLLESKKLAADVDGDLPEEGLNVFRMGLTIDAHSCGTAACIAGWASICMQGIQAGENGIYILSEEQDRTADRYCKSAKGPLKDLFYCYDPESVDFNALCDIDDISPSGAARALRNYLTTGKPSWGDAIEANDLWRKPEAD